MKNLILTILYFVFCIIFIFLENFNIFYLAIAIKGLIIPTLAIIYILKIKNDINGFHIKIILALFFSWIGDITLQFQLKNDLFFLIGLGSFLIAQLFYAITFFTTKGENKNTLIKTLIGIIYILSVSILISKLYVNLGDLKVPVIVYAAVITTMAIGSAFRLNKVNFRSFIIVLIGASVFILSDSLIAINKFLTPIEYARFYIMTSYVIAQYFIILGCLKQFNLSLLK